MTYSTILSVRRCWISQLETFNSDFHIKNIRVEKYLFQWLRYSIPVMDCFREISFSPNHFLNTKNGCQMFEQCYSPVLYSLTYVESRINFFCPLLNKLFHNGHHDQTRYIRAVIIVRYMKRKYNMFFFNVSPVLS